MTDMTMLPQALTQIGTGHYVAVSCLLFTIGFCGVALNRKNLIVILMSVELMLLAVNLNFAAFSAHLHDKAGQVFVIFILTIAAAEAAVGLAILVAAYRNIREIAVERMSGLKG